MRFKITDGGGADASPFVSVVQAPSADGEELYLIAVSRQAGSIRIEWTEKMLDHVSVWHPSCGTNRCLPQFFHIQKTGSCFYSGAPVLATVRSDGSVHRIVSLSDASSRSALGYYVDDFNENDNVIFFVELYDVKPDYLTELRIGKKGLPLADAVGEVRDRWYDKAERVAPQSELAFAPLYSTWYSYHQTPDQASLTDELRLAAECGFKTVILDDGWQIEGAGTKNYRKSGDWTPAPDKFPDLAGFVRDVHSFGQKLILWFAVPFAGVQTEAYRRFCSKLLFDEEGYMYAGTLDVRYPDVREYISDACVRFIEKYDIDGFKLDFIDHFGASGDIPPYGGGMDTEDVTDAVKLLLEQICRRAAALKPELLIEFRQNYVGPEILRYANMLRVGDCAYDAVTNRIGVADLRMLTRDVAVHSDMLLWSPDETPENCALQLLNVLFAVPQISIRLTRAGDEQIRLVKNHLKYLERNRDVLMGGRFVVRHPETGYSALSAEDAASNRRITALYTDRARKVDGRDEDIWNATGEYTLVVINDSRRRLRLTVCDCYGDTVSEMTTDAAAQALSVPIAGLVRVAAAP